MVSHAIAPTRVVRSNRHEAGLDALIGRHLTRNFGGRVAGAVDLLRVDKTTCEGTVTGSIVNVDGWCPLAFEEYARDVSFSYLQPSGQF